LDRLKGYLILFLSLFIFTMWGVNLLSLSQIDVDVPDDDGPNKINASGGVSKTVQIMPRPFLFFYFAELGYQVFCSATPPRPAPSYSPNQLPSADYKLMCLINPSKRMPQENIKEILDWVRQGGNLIIFMPKPHPMENVLGLEIQSFGGPPYETLYSHFSYLSDVEQISVSDSYMNFKKGMSFLQYFSNPLERSTILYTFRGTGRIVVFNNMDFTNPKGLERFDNLYLITRLAEHLAPSRSICFYDPDPGYYILAHVKTGGDAKKNMPSKKTKIPYLSLWSLIRANPISWVLLQLLMGNFLYFYSISRRLGKPIPLPQENIETQTYLQGMGKLLLEQGNASFAGRKIVGDFIEALKKRLSLRKEASIEEIIDQMEHSYPDIARELAPVLETYDEANDQSVVTEIQLLGHLQILDYMRKELKING